MGKVTNYVRFPGGVTAEIGEWEFATAATSVEVPTKMPTLVSTILMPESYSGTAVAGGEVMFCDRAITSGQVTVARKVAVDSALKFSYLFLGTYGSKGGSGDTIATNKNATYVPFGSKHTLQFGSWAFTTGDATVAVPSRLQTILTGLATPTSYTGSAANGGQVMYSTGAISSGQVTFGRKVAVDSAGAFSYAILGTYGSVGANPGETTSANFGIADLNIQNLLFEFGEASFTTTGTTKTVPARPITLIASLALPATYTAAAASGGHVMFCSKAISSGQTTFARRASVDSGLKFSFLNIGTYGSVGGGGTVTA